MTAPPGQVIGTPAWSLSQGRATFARNATVAQRGAEAERRTASVLDVLARRPGGPTVLHDLRIPGLGGANVDHVLVSGNRVLLIDTKEWAPGFYWTWRGRTRRGREPVPHVDKQTMAAARDRLARHLAATGALVLEPLVWVWPSSLREPTRTGLLRVPGARVMTMDRASSHVRRRNLSRTADPRVVSTLQPLVASWAELAGHGVGDDFD